MLRVPRYLHCAWLRQHLHHLRQILQILQFPSYNLGLRQVSWFQIILFLINTHKIFFLSGHLHSPRGLQLLLQDGLHHHRPPGYWQNAPSPPASLLPTPLIQGGSPTGKKGRESLKDWPLSLHRFLFHMSANSRHNRQHLSPTHLLFTFSFVTFFPHQVPAGCINYLWEKDELIHC